MHTLLHYILRLLAAAMGLAYVAGGLFVLLAASNPLALGGPVKVLLGVLLCLYGSYRLARAAKQTPVLM